MTQKKTFGKIIIEELIYSFQQELRCKSTRVTPSLRPKRHLLCNSHYSDTEKNVKNKKRERYE